MIQLKDYQSRALYWLQRYFETSQRLNANTAFYETTGEIYGSGIPYRKVPELPGLPYVCIRIPTGGGKTLVGCHIVGIANKYLLSTDHSLVVWLTPSETIREQTLKALRDRKHHYRQALDASLSNVVILDISEAKSVQRAALDTDTVIIVSTMQAFRREGTEDLNVYKENGNLMSHFTGLPDEVLKDCDRRESGDIIPSLVNVFRTRKPIVIVDEAHNARTSLSFITLARLSPSCIIELTATPNMDGNELNPPSNVLYSVSAAELKAEDMIKLPIRLKTHPNWKELLGEAISYRNGLEKSSTSECILTGEYVRPIMLLQAQPRYKERSSITVDDVEKCLIDEFRIPKDQVVRATGEDRGLDGIDVLLMDCPIRYIITVQALREGWDCPYAYILFSVAEHTSRTAVEQILGRIMRLPKAKKKTKPELNFAYAFTASNSFTNAAQMLQDGLVENGFERQEVKDLIGRLDQAGNDLIEFEGFFGQPSVKLIESLAKPIPVYLAGKVEFDVKTGKLTLTDELTSDEEEELKGCTKDEKNKVLISELCERKRASQAYEKKSPAERGEIFSVPVLAIKQGDLIYQFEKTHIDEVGWALPYEEAFLTEGEFSIANELTMIGEVDITSQGRIETRFLPDLERQMTLLNMDTGWSTAQLVHWIDRSFKHPDLSAQDTGVFLTKLITNMVDIRGFSIDQLVNRRYKLSRAVEYKINNLRDKAQNDIYQSFLFPECVTPLTVSSSLKFNFKPDAYPYSNNTRYTGRRVFKKHYYHAIGDLKSDGEEFECAVYIDSLPDVKYWVRNLPGPGRENTSFWLQTSTDKFYPDFICVLNDGRILCVEYKNERDWSNDDSREKRTLGELWEQRSNGSCLFVMPKGIDGLNAITSKILCYS